MRVCFSNVKVLQNMLQLSHAVFALSSAYRGVWEVAVVWKGRDRIWQGGIPRYVFTVLGGRYSLLSYRACLKSSFVSARMWRQEKGSPIVFTQTFISVYGRPSVSDILHLFLLVLETKCETCLYCMFIKLSKRKFDVIIPIAAKVEMSYLSKPLR